MNDAHALLERMKPDVRSWLRDDDVDLSAKYREAILELGAVPFLTELFVRPGNASLSDWIAALAFLWKDLSFQEWKEILYGVSRDAPATYHFVGFAPEYLAIDVLRIMEEDPKVDEVGRAFAKQHFTGGGPTPGAEWVRNQMEVLGVDQLGMWRRLASEGAPMKIDLPR